MSHIHTNFTKDAEALLDGATGLIEFHALSPVRGIAAPSWSRPRRSPLWMELGNIGAIFQIS